MGWGAPGGRRFAGFGARLGAAIIDGLILSPFSIIGRIVLSHGPKTYRTCTFDASLMCRSPSGSAWGLWFLITVAGFVAAILYYGLMEGRTGQTLGKRALSVRVVDAYTGADRRRSGDRPLLRPDRQRDSVRPRLSLDVVGPEQADVARQDGGLVRRERMSRIG